jgi:3-(3-hydroxy-phenyl)propionate hydroxylase
VQALLMVPPGVPAMQGLQTLEDVQGLAFQRYDARHGSCVLIRPDQHVAARWRTLDAQAVRAAVARATAQI